MTIIKYDPPLEATILHTLDDGTVTSVKCAVESYGEGSGEYWISYTDPEDDDACIMDHVDASELKFATTKDAQ